MKKVSEYLLAITQQDHEALKSHLYPGDGLEAAAILICGRTGFSLKRLCVNSIINVPYEECSTRTPVRLSWPGEYIEKAIDAADKIGGTIILIHSHPGGLFNFSEIDDLSDREIMPSLRLGSENELIMHGSAIMIPNGSIKARLYDAFCHDYIIDKISCIGENIESLSHSDFSSILPFSSQMTQALGEYSACVVGASGTGSIVIENLARRGIGKLVIIDFDVMKNKNLNRILNSTVYDAEHERFKTLVLKEAIMKYRPDIEIITVQASVESEEAIIEASGCDVIFSCTDTMEARHYCELMSRSFVTPLIDVGVSIPTRQRKGESVRVADVCGRIDYVHPNNASLTDRGVITPEGLYAEYLMRVDPSGFEKRIQEGYIKGFLEEAPSVLTLNMIGACLAVEEWMARLFLYRHDSNCGHNRIFFSLAGKEFDYEKYTTRNLPNQHQVGEGLVYPLLGLVQKSNDKKIQA